MVEPSHGCQRPQISAMHHRQIQVFFIKNLLPLQFFNKYSRRLKNIKKGKKVKKYQKMAKSKKKKIQISGERPIGSQTVQSYVCNPTSAARQCNPTWQPDSAILRGGSGRAGGAGGASLYLETGGAGRAQVEQVEEVHVQYIQKQTIEIR